MEKKGTRHQVQFRKKRKEEEEKLNQGKPAMPHNKSRNGDGSHLQPQICGRLMVSPFADAAAK